MNKEAERHIEAARLALISAQAGGSATVRLLTEELAALLTLIDHQAVQDERPTDAAQDWP